MVRFPYKAAKGRNSIDSFGRSPALLNSFFRCRLLAAITVIPALLCCDPPRTAPRLALRSPAAYESLDVFFFRSDALGRLDSYQRLSGSDSPLAVSTRGRRRMLVLANSERDRYEWSAINSYEGMKDITVSLRDESPLHPVMSAETELDTGGEGSFAIELEPLLSEIVLESVSCDFTGKTYEGLSIEAPCAYLTNVSDRCSPFAESFSTVSSTVNTGALNPEDLAGMLSPSMLYADLPEPITSSVSTPFLRFYCYPNQCPRDDFGSPWTRLVLEGFLDGETWYWPLDINRRDGDGIARNRTYRLNVTIMRKGVKDPDTAVGGEIARVSMVPQEWQEMDNVTLDL